MKEILHGNLNERIETHPETRSWFLGSFMEKYPEYLSDDVEMKWAHHKKGEIKPGLRTKVSTKTFVILIKGRFSIDFVGVNNKKIDLSKTGDYIYYDAKESDHEFIAIEDCLALIIRWPSKSKRIKRQT